MSRLLTIDIGAGTMDLLWYDGRSKEHFKAVAPSPVRLIAEQIEAVPGPLVVTGVEMGGGPVTEALRRRAQISEVRITASAAATLHHDLQKVREWGIRIVDPEQAERYAAGANHALIRLGDIDPGRIARIIQGLGLELDFEAVAVCAQDHGAPPAGVSHLEFRHRLFQRMLDRNPTPHTLMFRDREVPEEFNRLRSMVSDAQGLNARQVYVMDSGMAAMAGAVQDRQAAGKAPVIILDVATSHTIIAVMEHEKVAGFIEYHTRDLTLERIESLIVELAEGRVSHERILAEGGHGAYLSRRVGFESVQAIIVTGPKRRMMANTRLPVCWGAPWGDNMMTGTVGLLESLRRRLNLAPIDYN